MRKHRVNINEPGHAHELTFSCYRRFPFLKADRTCEWLAAAIDQARRDLNFAVWGLGVDAGSRPCDRVPPERAVRHRCDPSADQGASCQTSHRLPQGPCSRVVTANHSRARPAFRKSVLAVWWGLRSEYHFQGGAAVDDRLPACQSCPQRLGWPAQRLALVERGLVR
jgi:hypothetical protein